MLFRPAGLLIAAVACALPLLAVAWLRRAEAATSGPADHAGLPAPQGRGLQALLLRQELQPARLADGIRCRFPIGNGSDRPVTITGATISCGCAAIRFLPPTIQPGAWGEAVLTFATHGRFGPVDAVVEAKTDDGLPPLRLEARLLLPPTPRIASDEARIPPGTDAVEVAITGGDARFALACLVQPVSSKDSFTATVAADGTGLKLTCRSSGPRPAAARVRLRVGYDAKHAVDLALRVIAE